MPIEIWSDVVCPWCYVGKRNLETALEGFIHRDEVEVRWRAFELDPGAPRTREGRYLERLARKYGVTVDGASAMVDRMAAAGAAAGVSFRFDLMRPGNTFDAHRVLHLAAERGLQDPVKERLFQATFVEGRPIGEPDTLLELGAAAGLDRAELSDLLAGDAYGESVRDEERRASELGVSGVPFFLVDGRFGVPGAQPPEVLLQVLDRAWAKRQEASASAATPAASAASSHGEACEGDACAL